MKVLPISRYRFFQKIQPLSLLRQITSKPVTGCLQVFSKNAAWSFYFEDGKLIYACFPEQMFDLLYVKLQQMSVKTPTLRNKIVYQKLRVIFQNSIDNQAIPNAEYLAICWLVTQKFITAIQAEKLIKELMREVLMSYLSLKVGSYEFSSENFLKDMPKFCRLDINLLSASEQNQSFYTDKLDANPKSFPQSKRDIIPIQEPLPKPGYNNGFPITSNQLFQTPSSKKRYKVVCIDDNPLVVNVIKSFLDEQTFQVIGFYKPLQALMQIIDLNPDIILLDVEMPDLDGYELCSLLQKHAYFRDIPVIMVTGRKGLFDRVKAKMVGASGYLSKPFTQGELLKSIFKNII